MKFKDIDIYEMPEWMQSITVIVMNQCGEMLKRNPKYNGESPDGAYNIQYYLLRSLHTLKHLELVRIL